MLIPTYTLVNNNSPQQPMKVAIVGAGFSGLSVAYHLAQHNQQQASIQQAAMKQPINEHIRNNQVFDICILEARDRVGGRVFPHDISTDPSEPIWVDMGGQWIHESSPPNPLIQLLQELEIPLLYSAQNEAHKKTPHNVVHPPQLNDHSGTYLPDGTRVPEHLIHRIRKFYYKTKSRYNPNDINIETSFQDLLDQACQRNAASPQTKRRRPVGPRSKETFTNPKSDHNDNDNDIFDNAMALTSHPLFYPVLNCITHTTEVFEGGRLNDLSVALSDLYQHYGGPDEIAVGGYHAVLEKLVTFMEQESVTMRFQCPVQDIYYEPHPSTTLPSSSSSPTTTTTTAGVNIHFQDTTASNLDLQTLQADYCVCTVPLGVLQKGAMRFHPSLPANMEKSIHAIGMGTVDKVMMLFSEQFWSEEAMLSIAHEDPTRIQKFYDCSQDYQHQPVLAMLLGGSAAARLDCEGGLSDDQVIEEAMATLRTLFGPDTPDPVSFQISRWAMDPYAYGSYSYAKINSTETDYDAVALPGGKNLFFAGEHTSKHHHSTVHGAWETGKREAGRLIRLAACSSSRVAETNARYAAVK